MRLLVTGAKGQLGHDLNNELLKRGYECVPVDIEEMDITDPEACRKVITEANVDGVIHCAAYTAVDAAEDNAEICMKINRDGTANVAKVCGDLGIKLLYLSTDYVFDGEGTRPWEPDDERHPLNVYGDTKYQGEIAVTDNVEKFFIVRISWVFGINGKNFINTMLRIGEERGEATVVNDQIGSVTYTLDLSRLLVDMMETDKYGFYHATNQGIISWYDFACEIFKQAGMDVKVTPCTSDMFPAKAKRPHNSRMNQSKLVENGFTPLPDWKDALNRYLKEKGVIE